MTRLSASSPDSVGARWFRSASRRASSESRPHDVDERVEVIVQADLHQMHILADREPLWEHEAADRDAWRVDEPGALEQHGLRREADIVVFKLGGPIAQEGVLDADA